MRPATPDAEKMSANNNFQTLEEQPKKVLFEQD